MIFKVIDSAEPLRGRLKYAIAEHSFRFLPDNGTEADRRVGSEGTTSIVVGTLQLEISVEMQWLLYVWGYCPRATWVQTNLIVPSMKTGGIHLEADKPLIPGVSLRADATERLITHDTRNGWVRVAALGGNPGGTLTLIATGVAIGLTNGHLDSIWLHPTFE
jgi:hypothetical protein